MLYKELLELSEVTFDEFFKNVTIYENQFTFNEFNERCYDRMYANNTYSDVATVKKLKEQIPELKDICKKCAKFFIPARNKSIPKYDVILGGKYEEALMEFFSKKLNVKVERGDLSNRSYPDCVIYKKDGSVAAYFEVKFHGAPFIRALQLTGRYCYEGSATLDYKKIKKQLKIIKEEIDVPVYYVHWIEYPCLKGIFYEHATQVKKYINTQHVKFERKKREGDELKSKKSRYYEKMYSPLLELGSFEELFEEFKSLI